MNLVSLILYIYTTTAILLAGPPYGQHLVYTEMELHKGCGQ